MRIEFFGIDKLNFVEFNITGDDSNCTRLNSESRFINSEVFNLFVTCFEKSNDLYEYFEQTKFNARKIVVLRNELAAYLSKLDAIKSNTGFLNFVDSLFLGEAFLKQLLKMDPVWKDHWQLYLSLLKEINREMLTIVERCIDECRILWVIGY